MRALVQVDINDPQSIAAPATKCDIAALVNVIPGLLY